MAQRKVKLGNEWLGRDTRLLKVNAMHETPAEASSTKDAFGSSAVSGGSGALGAGSECNSETWIISLVFQNTRCLTQTDLLTGSQIITYFKL